MQPARRFLHRIIDYAGLFPPASLRMEDAVRAYADYLAGDDRDLLGMFIVPSSRLDELVSVLDSTPPASSSWELSVIAGTSFDVSRDLSRQFNESMTAAGRGALAQCVAIEATTPDADAARRIIETDRDGFEVYLEVPVHEDPAPIVALMSGSGTAAKIRTGGITEGTVPSPGDVLRFMVACREFRVPFKATAGLHHMVRGQYPLTYEADAPKGVMFGFLNIFVAAAALDAGWEHDQVLTILEATEASCFRFDEDGVAVNGAVIDRGQLWATRNRFALSFGSCSFTEPVGEARSSGLV